MLMDYFSCYQIYNKSNPLPLKKNLKKIKDCQIVNVIKI